MTKKQMLFVTIICIFTNNLMLSTTEIVYDKFMQDGIETVEREESSWIEKNKATCFVVGGVVSLALAAAYLYSQTLFVDPQVKQDNEQKMLMEKMLAVCQQALSLQEEERKMHKEQNELQKQQYHKQSEQCEL